MFPVPEASLPVGDVEIRQEHDFQPIADIRVAIDHFADRRDQFDHELGQMVAGGGLAAENERARLDGERRVVLDRMVQRHDVQHLQVLPLVFVNSLDQNVEHRFRVRDDAGALDGEGSKGSLVVLLDGVPAIAELGVVGERFEPP
jgi:hypothetical protein